jgi:pyruvate/2-oxoglutarate/acetoin dehydrogenase E1 component
MMKYFDELKRSMDWLGQKSDTFFLGQAVEYAGTAMTNTLKNVDPKKLLEMPVDEEMQMGITNGLALNGTVPISLFPRWNFLLLAVNQVVNHLDKIKIISDEEYLPKVIIRTGIGSERPLFPQYQHVGDFTEAFRLMCINIEVIRLDEPEDIFPAYRRAYEREDGKSTILVEWGDYYGEK